MNINLNKMFVEKTFHTDKELNIDEIQKFIDRHMIIANRYDDFYRLYIGDHPILHREGKPIGKPDNRLVVNHPKYIVDTYNGYFIGKPVKITHSDDRVNDYLYYITRYNDLDDHHADLSKKASIYGHAYELIYLDEQAQIGITHIDPRQCFLIYDNSIRQRTVYGVRYRRNDDGKIEGSYSDKENIYYFLENEDGNLYITDIEPHFFGGVPIIEYVENEEKIGQIEVVETLTNAYNKAISEKANDVDYFADAYMKILGTHIQDEDLERIRDYRIINVKGDDTQNAEVEFLNKPEADATQENLIDRLEKQIFSISMVANINDENFGTTSGIALKYKLLGMSNLANNKQRKFTKAMQERYRLIANVPNSGLVDNDIMGIEYRWTRNTPNNLKEEAEIANLLSPIVSDETVLNSLSIVSDGKAELKKIKEESKLDDVYGDFYDEDGN